jgi:hypothetical protein
MAADICILDMREMTGGLATVRFCLWFSVAPPYPAAGYVSAYPEINTDPIVGSSGQNIPSALNSGAIQEEVYSIVVPSAFLTGAQWASVVEPYIAAILNARKNYKSGVAVPPPATGLKYKVQHDSAAGWNG